jgi:MFS transporter, AAHS family, 4-hydroxybenzoate transporter
MVMDSTQPLASQIDPIIDGVSVGAFQKWTITLCALVAFVDGFDAQAIAFVAPVISQEWAVDIAAFGPVFGAGLLGLTIGAFLFGPIADRVGRKPMIVASVVIFGLGSLATAFAADVGQLIAYRSLTGFGLGGAMPNVIALTAEYAPKRVRAFVVTLMFCGFPFGAVIGGLISAWTIAIYGWTSVFVAGGVLPLLLVPALLVALPESIRFLASRDSRRADALALLVRIDPSAQSHLSDSPLAPAYGPQDRVASARLFQDGRGTGTLFLWMAFFCNLLVLYFLINWLPSVLQRAGIPLERAIIATVLLNAGGVVGGLTFSRLIDRFGPVRVLAAAYLGAAILVAAIGFQWSTVSVALAVVFAAGFSVIGAQFGINAFAAEYYPTSLRATGVGAALGVGRIGSIVGPVVGGFLLGMKLETGLLFAIAAAPALVAGLAILGAKRTPANTTSA